MNVVPLALYAAALVAYAWHFAQRRPLVGRTATTLLVAATLAHTFAIGMQTMEFVLPLLVALQTIPVVHPGIEDRAPVLQGPLFGVHVSSLLFAYASFALACVIGIAYVLLFKEIKAKHLGFFYARLPSLQVLDSMNQRAIVIGWIALTIGIIVGGVWAAQARVGYASGDPRVQAMSLLDPKIFVALLCWFVYSFELFAARRIGWGGRRAAYLSALGFAIVLLNFVPISYFFTSSHNF
jgi:ABC-type transport system involved in cytochrome c biogenesis permease subunit